MSIALLLEKYDVSTEEGLQRALVEIEKEEVEVDEALAGALSRACTLEGRLRATSQTYGALTVVKDDALAASDVVDRTAMLARDVSAKVRQLDLARSRVAECQRRVHDLIDLQLCSAGVEAAIKAHDYETGAAHVARFLSMDPGSVAAAQARGAPDPRSAMTSAAETLREHLVRKFEEAARKEDEAEVERLFRLFPQLGRADEGVDLLAKYLATQVESLIRRTCKVTETHSDGAVFADAFTRLLEAGGAAVERARATAAGGAPGRLPRAVRVIQPTICAGARRLASSLRAARRLPDVPGDPARWPVPPEPRQLEPVLAELALTHSRIKLYFNFLVRKTESDSSTLGEAARKVSIDAIERIINECDLNRTAQDLLGHYLALERYFLEESVNKALKMATPQPGVTSSSLVDDVFFIARKVIRRALSAASVDGACCVLNDAAALLERRAAARLRTALVAVPAAAPAWPAPPATATQPHAAAAREPDPQATQYFAHMNEAEAGAEWSERLAAEACTEAEPLLRSLSDRAKLQSCAAGLAAAAAAFRAARDAGAAAVRAALKPKAFMWADLVADPGGDADGMEDDADALPSALDVLADSLRADLPGAADTLLLQAVSDIAARAEKRFRYHTYTREGGLLVERRARRLAGWAGAAAPGARERAARLAQAAALLALELPEHAVEALRPTARLPPADAKEILARRTDFKMEDIKRLKL